VGREEGRGGGSSLRCPKRKGKSATSWGGGLRGEGEKKHLLQLRCQRGRREGDASNSQRKRKRGIAYHYYLYMRERERKKRVPPSHWDGRKKGRKKKGHLISLFP